MESLDEFLTTKKTIYIIRHGQTDYNLKGIIQGSGVDSDLNEKGRKQAASFFRAYHHIHFDKIYCSELKRTQQSVHEFTEKGIPMEVLSELNEINWGMMEGLKASREQTLQYERIIKDWKAGLLDRTIANGESPNALQKRQAIGLKKIMEKDSEKTVLIAMHGRAMRSFLSLILGTNLSDMDQYKHNNLCLYVVEYDGTAFKLKVHNSQEHLW